MNSKNLTRCMILGVAILFIMAAMPSPAQAQIPEPSVQLSKECTTIRVCDIDADCDDGNECTNDTCDKTLPNVVTCEITASYGDIYGDTIQILDLTDILNCSDPVQCPGGTVVTVNPPIVEVVGNTTCTIGAFSQCLIGPSDSVLSGLPGNPFDGQVTYRVTGYNPTPFDFPGPLFDVAEINVFDLCDSGIDTQACIAAPNRSAQIQAATILSDICENTPTPSAPCEDTDGNDCTEAGCDAAGNCDQLHITPDSTPCEPGGPLPECGAAPGCDGAGTCDPFHITLPDSTPCLDTDGNECTIAGCNNFVCDQRHFVAPDSTPCFDTDGIECTEAGCNEVGECDQLHIDQCVDEGCLSRAPGFWGNRPLATQYILDSANPPIMVCGTALTNVGVATPGSAIENMCVGGRDKRNLVSPQLGQLRRQCTAAALNVYASMEADGNCESESPGITARWAECCMTDGYCSASGTEISESGCIEDLDEFNNSDFGGFELEIPGDFPTSQAYGPGHFPPGPADSDTCMEANGNGFVN